MTELFQAFIFNDGDIAFSATSDEPDHRRYGPLSYPTKREAAYYAMQKLLVNKASIQKKLDLLDLKINSIKNKLEGKEI
jgi:hypothetical protein